MHCRTLWPSRSILLQFQDGSKEAFSEPHGLSWRRQSATANSLRSPVSTKGGCSGISHPAYTEFAATVAASAGNNLASYPLSLLNYNVYRAMPDFTRGLATGTSPPKSNINFANDYLDFYTYVKGKMPPQYFHMALGGSFLTDGAARTAGISAAKLKI